MNNIFLFYPLYLKEYHFKAGNQYKTIQERFYTPFLMLFWKSGVSRTLTTRLSCNQPQFKGLGDPWLWGQTAHP